jgi:two-component sensor histidine kinase
MKEAIRVTTASHEPPPEPARPGRRPRLWLVFLLVWTGVVVVALWWLLRVGPIDARPATWVLQDSAAHKAFTERARDWFRLIHLNFQRIYPWILFGPYVLWLGLRFALERGQRRVSLPVHFAACAVFAVAAQAINARTSLMVADVVVIRTRQRSDQSLTGREVNTVQVRVAGEVVGSGWPGRMAQRLFLENSTNHITETPGSDKIEDPVGAGLTNLFAELGQEAKAGQRMPGPPTLQPLSTLLDLLAYAAMVGLAQSVHFYGRYRDRERRTLALESSLARSRLDALQAQLQPHFLFNTLNAIATLVRRDPKAAEATLVSLSELLRLSLSQSGRQEIPLREELEFLDRYLDIQQTRFGDRLRFEKQIEPETLDCLVPSLLLQPLVENAIRHGIEPSERGGTVRVAARQEHERLALSVEDDGVGLASEPPVVGTNGIGLTNLRARLEALYGACQKMELASRPRGGTAVRVEIPLHSLESRGTLAHHAP